MTKFIMKVLCTYSLTYLEVVDKGHTAGTLQNYFDRDPSLVLVIWANQKFIVRRGLDITRNSKRSTHVIINGTLYWKDGYLFRWFILKEEVLTCIFGKEGVSLI